MDQVTYVLSPGRETKAHSPPPGSSQTHQLLLNLSCFLHPHTALLATSSSQLPIWLLPLGSEHHDVSKNTEKGAPVSAKDGACVPLSDASLVSCPSCACFCPFHDILQITEGSWLVLSKGGTQNLTPYTFWGSSEQQAPVGLSLFQASFSSSNKLVSWDYLS